MTRRRQILVGDLLDLVILDVELAGIAMDADLRQRGLVARHLHDVVARDDADPRGRARFRNLVDARRMHRVDAVEIVEVDRAALRRVGDRALQRQP
jgi:hypothetical protein